MWARCGLLRNLPRHVQVELQSKISESFSWLSFRWLTNHEFIPSSQDMLLLSVVLGLIVSSGTGGRYFPHDNLPHPPSPSATTNKSHSALLLSCALIQNSTLISPCLLHHAWRNLWATSWKRIWTVTHCSLSKLRSEQYCATGCGSGHPNNSAIVCHSSKEQA